jgi:thiamine biosynthesis lipoprotein ApbE
LCKEVPVASTPTAATQPPKLFLAHDFAYPWAMATKTPSLVRHLRYRGAVLGLAILLLSACGGEEQKRQLADLQRKSEERVAQVEKQYKDQIAGLEKQLEALRLEAAETAAKAKSQVDEAVAKAQASVDDAEKEANVALGKARDAYRSAAKTKYANLNKELAEVTAKAQKVPAKSKAAYDVAIKTVLGLQKEILKDITAYDKATLETLGKTKAKVDIDLAKYKLAINAAKARLPH